MERGSRIPKPVLVVGPLPPPHFGIATSMGYLREMAGSEELPLVFLDIADRRGLANIGLLEAGNVGLALRHALQFLGLLALRRPRVVYVSLSQGKLGFLRDCLFLVPARLMRRKVVIHLHGGFFRQFYESQPGWIRWLMRWQLRGAARVVVLGERFRGMFIGLVPPDRVAVIPNGVELNGAPARVEPAVSQDGLRILYLGAVCQDKGVLDLLDAVGRVRDTIPAVRLTLAGESYAWEEEAIRGAIEEHGLTDVVERPGVVVGEAKARAFAGADLFVFPSRNPVGEGQPFVLLEAMAAGLPVVTTDIGAAADTVVDGTTGLVVAPGEPGSMAAAILRLGGDQALRRRMGAAGLDRVRTCYSLGRWRESMVGMFTAVAEGR